MTEEKFRQELVSYWKDDIGRVHESAGKNRGPIVDVINAEIGEGATSGSPYCIAGLLIRGVKRICQKYGLHNSVYMTPGTQDFWAHMKKYRVVTGKLGDIAIMQSREDSDRGHAWAVLEKRLDDCLSVEYNTNVLGSRDGDGCYSRSRSIEGDSTKRHLGFIDVVQCLKESNEAFFKEDVQHESKLPLLAWGDKPSWTAQTLSCVAISTLPDLNPADGDEWHPLFMLLSREERVLFWAQFISIVCKPESGFDPGCVEKGDVDGTDSIGLLQLSYEDQASDSYNIPMGLKPDDLKDPEKNLDFGVRIMEKLIAKDGYISHKSGSHWKGLSEYWLTLQPSEDGHDEIKAYVRRLNL